MRVVAAALVVCALAARRADAGARLDVAPGACALERLPDRVRALGGAPDAAGARVVRVSTEADGDGVIARVSLDDTRGVRTVRATDCAHLTEAVALVIAVALARDPEPPPAPPADAPLPPIAPLAPPSNSISARIATSPRTPLAVAASFASSIGRAGDRWTETFAIGARVRRGARSLGLELAVQAPDRIAIGSSSHVEVSTTAITIAPCAHHGRALACALVSAGWLTGRGDGLMDARTITRPVIAAGARLGWEVPLSPRVDVTAQLGVRGNVTSTRFLVDQRPVWSSARVEAAAAVGLIAHFP
jgi:hypothetical protein